MTEAWRVRCAVFMPDHLHPLITLGRTHDLSSVVRLLKGRLTPVLREKKTAWQQGFYDHRLRDGEDVRPVFLYIFLYPYRAGLCPADEKWSGYICCPEDWHWFGEMTKNSLPQPEWLR